MQCAWTAIYKRAGQRTPLGAAAEEPGNGALPAAPKLVTWLGSVVTGGIGVVVGPDGVVAGGNAVVIGGTGVAIGVAGVTVSGDVVVIGGRGVVMGANGAAVGGNVVVIGGSGVVVDGIEAAGDWVLALTFAASAGGLPDSKKATLA